MSQKPYCGSDGGSDWLKNVRIGDVKCAKPAEASRDSASTVAKRRTDI
jgi:hypothetical protein